MKPALAFLAWLALTGASFTLPQYDRAPTSCTAGAPLTGLAYVRVQAVRQSPTWVSKRDSMLLFPDMWTRYWPVVRAEAAEATVSRTRVSVADAGKKYTFVPALNWRPAWVRVVTEDDSSNVSCPSNWLYFPEVP